MPAAGKSKLKIELYSDFIINRLHAKRRRVLFAQGAYVKKTMTRQQRWSKKPSEPGKPPHAHRKSGGLLRKLIRFAVDLDEGSVVIGPIKFGRNVQPANKTVPELLNDGGITYAHLHGRQVRAEIEARPFTTPVFSDGGRNFEELTEKEKL